MSLARLEIQPFGFEFFLWRLESGKAPEFLRAAITALAHHTVKTRRLLGTLEVGSDSPVIAIGSSYAVEDHRRLF